MRSLTPTRLPLVLLCLALLLGACDNAEEDLDANTIFGLVNDADDLDRLEALVRETELAPILQTRQDLTLFAPTDLALERLGPDMLAQLAGNRDVLLKILRRHIVPGRFRVADLRDGDTLTPLDGPPLTVRIEDDRVFVGGARLTIRRTDFETGNGIVHYLDDVVRDHLTLAERLRVTPLASDFADVLQRAGLSDLLDNGEPYTLLIPIDNAFSAFGGDHLQYLLRSENRSVLQKILRHHIVPGRVRIEDLEETDALMPLDGSPLSVEEENTVHYFGGARVIAAEVETSDGLIYLLDRIVLNHLSLAERIQIHPYLTKYHTLLDHAGVLDELRGTGPYTVFLPTDASLTSLGGGFVPALVERPDQLLLTAQYTVALGVHDREALLQGGSLPTLSGHDMLIRPTSGPGGVVFAGERSQVTFPPLEAANGLLYTVSPFEHPPGLSLEGQSVFFGLYRFLSLMEQAGLTHVLRGDEEYSIFAPTDEALEAVEIPPGSVPYRMGAHVVEEAYLLDQLLSGLELTALSDTPIVVISTQTGIYVNYRPLLRYTTRTRNGVFYVIDGVLP